MNPLPPTLPLSASKLYCVSEEDAHEGVLNGVNFVDEGGEEGVEAAEGGWGAGGGATFEVSFSASTGWTPAVCKECMAAASNRADMERSVFQVLPLVALVLLGVGFYIVRERYSINIIK